jgi:hypothetical protein
MASRHLSLRIGEATYGRLEAQGRRYHENVSEIARRLLEEGLRIAAHPGIVFRDSVTGRQAALAGGPALWWIIMDFRDWHDESHPADQTVGGSSAYPHDIRTAQRYYADFPEELDERIALHLQESEKAYSAWLEAEKTAVG